MFRELGGVSHHVDQSRDILVQNSLLLSDLVSKCKKLPGRVGERMDLPAGVQLDQFHVEKPGAWTHFS